MDLAVYRIQNEMPCPVCGQHANYTWGNAMAPYIRPAAQPLSWRQRLNEPMAQSMMVRTCNECSNIQFFKQNPPPESPDQ